MHSDNLHQRLLERLDSRKESLRLSKSLKLSANQPEESSEDFESVIESLKQSKVLKGSEMGMYVGGNRP